MKVLLKYCFWLLPTFLALELIAQPTVLAELDTNVLRIGEQTLLHLTIDYRVDDGKVADIKWPIIGDTLKKEIEVLEISDIDTLIPDKIHDPFLFRQQRDLLITSFDSGFFAIHPFDIEINGKILSSEALLLEVQNVQISLEEPIKDIKHIYDEPRTLAEWLSDNWVWLLSGGSIALVLALLFILRKLKTKQPLPIKVEEVIPLHQRAIDKLNKIKEEKLWQKGEVKKFHTDITDVVRWYIEEQFNVRALEQTTDELLQNLKYHPMGNEPKIFLSQLLHRADMVKFAKEIPLASEHDQSIQWAYDFISKTKMEDLIDA